MRVKNLLVKDFNGEWGLVGILVVFRFCGYGGMEGLGLEVEVFIVF